MSFRRAMWLGAYIIAMVPMVAFGDLEERYPFPASNAPGASGAYFVTAVDILNADDDPAQIRLQLLERDADNSQALESAQFRLDPGEVRRFKNVLGEVFGVDGENFAGGAAVLSDSDDLLIVTRTVDISGSGTKGGALPARPQDEMVSAGDREYVLFLTENADYRSNLGLREQRRLSDHGPLGAVRRRG
jgi:hypothetical protein